MGADLFINSLYESNRAEWEPQFEAAGNVRDSLAEGSTERVRAQERMSYCYEQMLSRGYFRDPYNDWDLLWKFGLSWWQDVIPMLDENSRLSAAGATRLLALLKEREAVFENRTGQLDKVQDQESFRTRYAALRRFLNQAIALDEPIECSL